MLNVFKLFGITALVAVIGFSMISCDMGGGGVPPLMENGGESIILP
jgi:hypothetical protein